MYGVIVGLTYVHMDIQKQRAARINNNIDKKRR